MVDSNKKMAMERDKDRISALPDPILHYILSLLGTKQVVETSFLSTRWRNLWISVPALNFDHSLWKKRNRLSKNKRNVKNNFMNFVDNVLFRHDGTNVTKFKISCSTFCDFDRFGGWMTIAAGKQVQEYHIDFVQFQAGYYESKELPGAIFCTGVTIFKFYVRSTSSESYSLIRMPNSISSSPQLKTLVLSYVELPQGNSNGELVLSCPLLETLVLECCIIRHLTILDISTLQLKNLVFHIYPLVETCQVKIFTPVLESLRIEGLWNSNFSFGSLTSLVSAKIKNQHDSSKIRYFIRFLESISCATTIELCWILKHPNQDILEKTQISFSNLKYLKVGYSFMPYSSTILKFFKSAPYLETLLFHVYNMKESQEGFYHLNFDHLKSLDIGLFNCCKYEMALLEYLLKNAVVLEKLTVKIGTYRGKFVDRIDSLVKAFSSKVVLSITR